MRIRSDRIWIICCLVAGMLPCSGCTNDSQEEEDTASAITIKLGSVLDRTSIGKASWTDAAQLAVSHMNEALVKENSAIRFELMIRDSKNSPKVAVPAAQELVEMGAKGLITDVSSVTREIAMLQYSDDESDALNVPLVGVVASAAYLNNPDYSDEKDPIREAACRDADGWVFRTTMASTVATQLLLKEAFGKGDDGDANEDGIVKIGVFCGSTAGADQAIIDGLQKFNPDTLTEIIKVEPTVDANDVAWFEEQVAELSNDTPDGYPDALTVLTSPLYQAAITQAYSNAAITTPMIHSIAFRDNAILSLGRNESGRAGPRFLSGCVTNAKARRERDGFGTRRQGTDGYNN